MSLMATAPPVATTAMITQKSIYVTMAIIIVSMVATTLYVAFARSASQMSGEKIPDVYALPYPADANYRQTRNNCGPYSAAAAIRALDGKDSISSEDAVAKMPMRVPGYFTMPQGISAFLRSRGFTAEIDDVSRLEQEAKTKFLQEKLAASRAVILLVGRSLMTQHYITLLGYDRPRGVFFVYNPALAAGKEKGQTIDSNGAEAGNVTMSTADLFDYWKGGGVFGFYRWTALVVGKK